MSAGRPFKVGVTIHPQQCTISELRDAWRRADDLGVDSIWFWDHFYPLYGDPEGNQFECWSLLAAASVDTRAPQIGPMVTCIGYRNPDLFTFAAEGRFVDDQFEDEENLQRLTGYFLVNASLSRRLPFWNGEAFIAGENLADRDYPVDRGGGILKIGSPLTVQGGLRFRL